MRVSDTNQIRVNWFLRARPLRLLILDHILAILQHVHIISTQTSRLRTRLATTERQAPASRHTAGSPPVVYSTTRLRTISISSTTTVTTEPTRTKTRTHSETSSYSRFLWASLNATTTITRATARSAHTPRTLHLTIRRNGPPIRR